MKRALVAVASLLVGCVAPLLVSAPAHADTDAAGSTLHTDYIGTSRPDAGHYDRITDRGVPVGRHDGGVTRGLWELSLPALPTGSLVMRADLDMHTQSAGGCRQAPFDLYAAPVGFDQHATWNAPPAVHGPVASTLVPYSPGPCAQGYFGFDLTATVAGSYRAGGTSLAVELRAQDENDPNAFKYLATAATLVVSYDAPPGQPVVSAIDQDACAHLMPVVAQTQSVQAFIGVSDPDDTALSLTVQLYTANRRTQVASDVFSAIASTTESYPITPAEPLVSGAAYALRAITRDQHLRSVASSWCYFRVDDRVPSTPTQSTTSFGTTSPIGNVGVPGTITVGGGGPATARYELTSVGDFPVGTTCAFHSPFGATLCTNDGAPVTFTFTPTQQFFQLCVDAVSRAGAVSNTTCQFYVVNPPVLPPVRHEWVTTGVAPGATTVADSGTGSPVLLDLSGVSPTSDARLGFTDASTATAHRVIDFGRPWSALLDVETAADNPQTVAEAGPLTVQVDGSAGAIVCLAGTCGTDPEVYPGQSNQLVLTWNPHTGVLSVYGLGQVPQATVTVSGLAAGPHDLVFGGDSAAPFTGSIGTTELFTATLPAYDAAVLIQTW